jgi:adenylosuccinate lyase
LTESEIQEINSKSKLVKKYEEVMDRESAYEMLNKKIESAQEQVVVEQEKTQDSNEPSTASVVTKSVLKVVTSASFIRGAFGILSKMFKK